MIRRHDQTTAMTLVEKFGDEGTAGILKCGHCGHEFEYDVHTEEGLVMFEGETGLTAVCCNCGWSETPQAESALTAHDVEFLEQSGENVERVKQLLGIKPEFLSPEQPASFTNLMQMEEQQRRKLLSRLAESYNDPACGGFLVPAAFVVELVMSLHRGPGRDRRNALGMVFTDEDQKVVAAWVQRWLKKRRRKAKRRKLRRRGWR